MFTTRPPIEISPPVMFSRPAIMRSRVDLPQPEGPTSTTNSPSAISTSTPCRILVLPKDFRACRTETRRHTQPPTRPARGGYVRPQARQAGRGAQPRPPRRRNVTALDDGLRRALRRGVQHKPLDRYAGRPSAACRPARRAHRAWARLASIMYLPAFPAMESALSATPAAIQRTLAAFLIGIAAGQLVFGPLSDRHRAPAAAAHGAGAVRRRLGRLRRGRLGRGAGAGCAWLQALGGCAGMVVARAVVRDVCDERGAVRMMAMLMLVDGRGADPGADARQLPARASSAGARIFWVLAVYGAAAMLVVWSRCPRASAGAATARRCRAGPAGLPADRCATAASLRMRWRARVPMLGLFAYLVGSPDVLDGPAWADADWTTASRSGPMPSG